MFFLTLTGNKVVLKRCKQVDFESFCRVLCVMSCLAVKILTAAQQQFGKVSADKIDVTIN
jgi:hypothetical protein